VLPPRPTADLGAPWTALTDWFARKGWTPFDFQQQTWSAHADGHSGLVHASTGTGKTYAVWFGPLLAWLRRHPESASWPTVAEPLEVIWLTPLRALAADTAANLQAPLTALGLPWTLETRTSDTGAAARARQRARLPTVLVTTPESLSVLLARSDSQAQLARVRTVIVDEWHELLGSKRGVQTELALARLRRWQPHLCTWGLSATLGNLDTALTTLVGVGATGQLIRGAVPKSVQIEAIIPPQIERFPWAGHLGLRLLPQVLPLLDGVRSALVFTNTRAQTELWYQAILAERPTWAGQMALHHSALDPQTRGWVEDGLRTGTLRCVVCTSSLDLGVDFAPVDCVVQVGSPKGVARLLQRAGRSGHQPGQPSRVVCVPTHALELLEVAAVRNAAAAGQIEGRTPLTTPLDVLAQHLVTVALGGGFVADELLAEVRSTHAYQALTTVDWNWVLDFVTQGGSALRAYPEFQRVSVVDGVHRVVNERLARRHRLSIGTIVSESAVQVRYLRGAKLGTVEESFVARLRPGDRFVFAGKTVEFIRVRELTAYVKKASNAGVVPRWTGGRLPLSSELASALRAVFAQARRGVFVGPEMTAVRPLLELQARRSAIPTPGTLLIERLRTRAGHHLFWYPFAGRAVHEGLAALLALRLSRRQPLTFTLAVNDYGLELLSATPVDLERALDEGVLSREHLAADIAASLNAVELARRHFREVARIAGLVTPGLPGAAKTGKYLQAATSLFFDVFVNHDPENLLLHQARREVLEQQLEHQRLEAVLRELDRSAIDLREVAHPTPLGFPLLVERLREHLSSEQLADRVRKMQLVLEGED
jgi:ATP-dependent Lhr-like helicase